MKNEQQPDGTYRMLVKPWLRRKNTWHRSHTNVPEIQWSPETGMSRYEWEREITPEHQLEVFEELRRLMQDEPPQPVTREMLEIMAAGTCVLHDGMPGYNKEVMDLLEAGRFEHHRLSPDDCWRFTLMADDKEAGVLQRVIVSHRDYRTLADWNLLIRLRSWVWPDDADVFMWLPGQDTTRNGWEARYENGRPNAMQLCCPVDLESEDA